MTIRRTTIVESSDGGKWTWMEQDRKFKSLAAALKADDKDAARIAATTGKVVTVREIKPNTRIGALIAFALTKGSS